jgi:hypothetical protein
MAQVQVQVEHFSSDSFFVGGGALLCRCCEPAGAWKGSVPRERPWFLFNYRLTIKFLKKS